MNSKPPIFEHKFIVLFLLLLCASYLSACASHDLQSIPAVNSTSDNDVSSRVIPEAEPVYIKLMTLNMAHARGDGLHQIFQKSRATKRHLDEIGELIKEQRPDIVALQEADGPSFWSGNFNHVEYLARNGSLTLYVQGEHVKRLKLSYGTALLSGLELLHPLSVTFNKSLSPVPKGFLVSTFRWPGQRETEVDIVSVHLDVFSKTIRRKQAYELIGILKERNRPMIIMGDFNSGWNKKDSALHLITEELGLEVYRPKSQGMQTFPLFNKRVDWIIISPHFKFLTYQVLSDKVSDHLGVVAVLDLAYSMRM